VPPDIPHGRAILDRIVNGVAVLQVGTAATTIEVPAEALPDHAREGDAVAITRDDRTGTYTIGPIDDQLTQQRRTSADERLARLRNNRRPGRFG
jgi:hypothetical protein